MIISLLFACSAPAPQSDVVTPVVEEAAVAAPVGGAVSLVVSSRGDGEIEPCG